MTTPDPAAPGPNSEQPIDLGKKTSGPAESQPSPNFGPEFDYDATAQASLSEPPPTSESTAASPGTAGPGWDTYSGIGNGPGWGTTPSYPPPSDYSSVPQQPAAPPQPAAPTGPVYGTPNPQYPMGEQPGYGAPGGYGGATPPPPQPYGVAAPGYGQVPGGMPGYGYVDPSAPYGRDPLTGEPYSDKSRMTAGLLEILLGAFGAGRFYLNQPGLAIAQIAVTWLTCGLGGIWPLIDGIMMLTGKVRDENGRPLKP